MTQITVYSKDTLKVRVTVKREETPVALTGASFAAAIGIPNGKSYAGSVTPVDLLNGIVDVFFDLKPMKELRAMRVMAELQVELGGEAQTVWAADVVLKNSVINS